MGVSVVGEGVVIVFRIKVVDVEEKARRRKKLNVSYKQL